MFSGGSKGNIWKKTVKNMHFSFMPGFQYDRCEVYHSSNADEAFYWEENLLRFWWPWRGLRLDPSLHTHVSYKGSWRLMNNLLGLWKLFTTASFLTFWILPMYLPIGEGKFKAASTFRYLGDAIGEASGYVDLTNACITAEWKNVAYILWSPQKIDRNVWTRRANDFMTPVSLPRGCPHLRLRDVII